MPMQLFNLLKQAQQSGPNEREAPLVDAQELIKRENNAESKGNEQIHNDSKMEMAHGVGLAHMRIDEVEDEHENTKMSEEEQERRAQEIEQDEAPYDRRKRSSRKPSKAYEDSPTRRHRDSKGSNVFKNSNQFQKSQGSVFKRSFDRANQGSPVASSHGMACIIDPAEVEPQSPNQLNESLEGFHPKTKVIHSGQPVIDIYVDQETPVATSGFFKDAKHDAEEMKQSRESSVENEYVDKEEPIKQTEQSEADLSSPKIGSKRYTHRDSQRNYFRRDQENKALVNSLKKSAESQKSMRSLAQAEIDTAEKIRQAKNISQHDQNLGGQNEHNGSQHDESQLKNFAVGSGSPEYANIDDSQQWHDIKVIQSEAGSQELVIENLENLGDATALVVTRQGGQFKIGIQQDKNMSDVMSNANSHGRVSTSQALSQKIKLRGKFNVGPTKQHQLGILPPAINPASNPATGAAKFRTVSVNSQGRSSKASARSRTMPQQANDSMVVPNKYKTFQDPISLQEKQAREAMHTQEVEENYGDGSNRFRKRIRESASDNKRLLGEQRNPERRSGDIALELRSHYQSAQAEEIIRQSRDMRQQQQAAQPAPIAFDTLSQHSRQQKEKLGHISIVDPLRSTQRNPNDRSDSKLGPTSFSNNLLGKRTQDTSNMFPGSLYQKSTHVANSSVRSRDQPRATDKQGAAPLKQSTVSIKLQDQQQQKRIQGITALDQSMSSFMIPGDHQPHISLSVKQGKKDFQSLKKGMAVTGLHGLERTPQPGYGGFDSIHVEALGQTHPGPIIYEEGKSRASMVSRRSNTDMKGAELVRISPARTKDYSPKGSPRDGSGERSQPKSPRVFDSQLTSKSKAALGGPMSQINAAPDKQLTEEVGASQSNLALSPPKTADADPEQQVGKPLVNQPSRTDTAFYDGKVSQTETKPKGSGNVPPTLVDKQLSEAPGDGQSPKGNEIDASEKLNYHTTAEDAGDGYFPQILKYTENAPQESILSRDNYSTSQQPSMISRANQRKQSGGAIGGQPRVKKYFNKNNPPAAQKRLSPVRDSQMTEQKSPVAVDSSRASGTLRASGMNGQPLSKLPKSIMNQNVARVEKQNPSTKASILSHSVQEADDAEVTNLRASADLENVTEEGTGKSPRLNKDGSAYNITPNEIAAIPQKNKEETMRSSRAAGSPKRQGSKQVPQLDMDNVRKSQEVGSPARAPSLKHQKSKASMRSSAVRSSAQKQPQLTTQRSKASLNSKKSKGRGGSRAQSMLPSLSRQGESATGPTPSISNRLQPKKSDRSSTLNNPNTLRNSAKKKQLVGPFDSEAQIPNQNQIVGNVGMANTQPNAGLQTMKLPQVTSPIVGQHLADPSSRTNAFTKGPSGGPSARSSPRNSPLNRTVAGESRGQPQVSPAPVPRAIDNNSMLDNMAHDQQVAASDGEKPIMKYMEASDAEQKSYPLKYFKGQDLELYYMEKQLKPGVEREIKEGFFEIRKKFGEGETAEQQVQVYVSHLCLHNYHPIFCKFNLDVVKTILNFSQIIYLKKGQTLYQQGFNDRYLYVILFGKLRLSHPETDAPIGSPLNIGWTVGEEILFKSDRKASGGQRLERCRSMCESCVLGIEKRSLAQIKRTLVERGQAEEFVKLEVVLRGNYLVKKAWRA